MKTNKIMTLALAAAMLLASVASAADSGLSPQFIRWRKMRAAGLLPQQRAAAQAQDADSISLSAAKGGAMAGFGAPFAGLAPDVAPLGYLSEMLVGASLKPATGYPARYDLRDHGGVTPVRDQGAFETCWAFASYGSLESSILVQKPEDQTYTAADIDFSERHMAANHGYDLTVQNGGSMLMAMAYLLRWDGPASEASAPYPADGATAWPAETPPGDGPRLHVQQVRWLPGKTAYLDNDAIKRHVMEFGGVYVTFYAATNLYFNAETASYYCPSPKSVNHGVTIVGWDDGYPRTNFKPVATFLGSALPPGNGAYLAKNSWGEDFGQSGYFWVSYYDANFALSPMAVFNGSEPKSNYSTIYQYDELGYTGKSHSGNSRAGKPWMANVFTAESDDQIKAVGFYALAPSTQYRIRVFTDVAEGGDPSTGTLRDSNTQVGELKYAGYYTVPLDKVVPVAAGTRFAVAVELYSKNLGYVNDLGGPLAYEAPVPGYSTRASAAAGQSFFSGNGTKWYDLTTSVPGANFCVKAYGIADRDEGEFIESLKPVALEVEGPQVVAAGASGEYVLTMVFDDNSRWTGFESEYEILSGAEAIAESRASGNRATLTVRDDLPEDVDVAVRFSATDDVSDVTVSSDIRFTATRALPAAPEGLRATAGTVELGVRLAWNEVPNASAYAVYRSSDGNPRSAVYLATVDGTKYTDLSAEPGLDYTYFVKAQNSSGASAFSEGADGWRALAPPAELTATDGDYDYVQLEWQESPGANFYKVFRATDMDEDGNPVAPEEITGWIAKLAFQDTPPAKGVPYLYWVKAAMSFTGHRESGWSIFDIGRRAAPVEPTSVQVEGEANVPAGGTAAYSLAATFSDGLRQSPVTNAVWRCPLTNDVVTGVEFVLEALVDGGLVATNTLVTVTGSWTFEGEDGPIELSDVKYVVVSPIVPAKPNAVKVVSATTDGIALEWLPVDGAGEYRLYRGETAETATLLATVDGLSYLDTKAMPGATYRYWLEAVNAAGASERSDPSAGAMRQFTPPIYVTASNGSSTDLVQVSWRGVTGARFYRVLRSETPDGEPHDLSGWIGDRTYGDPTADPGRTYWYFVQAAYDAEGTAASDPSLPTIGMVSPAQTLAFIEIDGPSSIQYDSQGAFVCTATYANGVQKRVQPSWSFKSANELVAVNANGIVEAGHVTGSDLHLELQASFTDGEVTKTDSFAITVIAFVEQKPSTAVSNVVVRARWPWNGIVDITYDLYSVPATTRAVVTVSGRDHDLERTLHAVTLSGDGVDRPAAGGAPHRNCHVVWDLGADYENFHASAFSVSLDAAPFAVAPPADFRASDGTSTNAVELAWEEAFGAEGYEIWRQLADGSDDKVLVAVVTNGTEFADADAVPGETYHYWIRTIAGEFETDVSEEAGPAAGRRAVPPQVPPSVDLRRGLVAYYPFDGNFDDASGNGHHLVHVLGTAPAGTADRTGAAGTAYRFGGVSRLCESTNFVTQTILTNTFTFAGWFRTDATTSLRNEQTRGINTGCNFLLHPAHGGNLDDDARGTVGYGIAAGRNGINLFEYCSYFLPCTLRHEAAFGAGWHHVAFSVENSGAPVLYVDGAYVRTGVDTGKEKFLYVGNDIGGEAYGKFTGDLDDLCYYDRALDAAEVAALFQAGSPLSGGGQSSAEPAIDIAYAAGEATVTISCTDAAATIYYSVLRTDGGATVDTREYTVPFAVRGNATVIAWSVREGFYDSARVRAEIRAAWKADAETALSGDGRIGWETGGDTDWVFDPDVASDGGAGSMRSGAIVHEQASTMTARFSGAGQFAFDWKVSSESGFDFLSVVVDGETPHRISGEVDWTELVLEFTNDAPHVVTWIYAKDGGVDRGRDCGWVDHVTWARFGDAVDPPVATVTPVGGGASNRVELACANVVGATIEYRVDLFGEEGEWAVYEGPFHVAGEGFVLARAKKSGYIDSFVSRTPVARPWIVRVGEALLMDEVTRDAVTLEPDYYGYGIDEAFWWDQDRRVVSDGTCASVRSPALGDGPENDPAGIGASIFARVSGPGTLYFDWKVDSEAGWDVLTYYAGEEYADYAYAEAISGDRDWERIKLVFTQDAEHVIEWEYNKDDRGAEGRDCGWVDFLEWIPARFAPDVPSARTGYVFQGWATNENGAVVYEPGVQLDAEDPNETFVAVWTPITYQVVYDAAPAFEGAPNRQTVAYDETREALSVTNFVFARGYSFRGWSLSEGGEPSCGEVDGLPRSFLNLASEQDAVVTFHPVLSPVSYTVKFREGAQQAAPDVAATYDVDFTLPTPAERAGWRFEGWSATESGADADYASGATVRNLADTQGAIVVLYARWTEDNAFGAAVEQPTLDLATSGSAEWFVQNRVVYHGDTALQSGAIGANQSSTLSTTVIAGERTRISFWWKVSSEQGWDFLTFCVNGETKGSISGTADGWQPFSVVLPAGTNRLDWTYSKDGSVNRGDDCGWLDWITIEDLCVHTENGDVFVAEDGSDETGDGSEANPFRTIQKGVDWVSDGRKVYVKPGLYTPFRTDNRRITIESTGGASVTFVEGVHSNRCATLADNVGVTLGCAEGFVNTVLRGLTLRNGYIQMEGARGGGGGVQGGTLYNCVIQSNVSTDDGGGALGSRLVNCVVIVNYAGDSGLAISGGGCRSCSLYNCTVYDNRARSNGAGIGYSLAYNSIIWHNYLDDGTEDNVADGTSYRSRLYNCITDRDPLFRDAANGDFTLLPGSPAIDAGKDEHAFYATDFAGNARVVGASVDCGAFEYDSSAIVDPPETEPGAFRVVQYCINTQPYTIDDAVAATNMPSIWTSEPAIETYQTINFRDNMSRAQNFQSGAVRWPATVRDGRKSDYFVCQITATIDIPEAGDWTFACGSDDGFRCILTDEDGKEYSFEYFKDRAYDTTLRTFHFTKAGTYRFYLIYFEYVDASALDVSCARGARSAFNSNDFKLIGTPESGVTLVGEGNH